MPKKFPSSKSQPRQRDSQFNELAQIINHLTQESSRDAHEIAASLKAHTRTCWKRLSPREQLVIALHCLGYADRQIAEKPSKFGCVTPPHPRHT